MRGLLRAWIAHAWMDWMALTRDLKQCLVWVVSDAVLTAAGVTAVLLLAIRFDGIGVWSRPQIVFMLGYAALVKAGLEMMFGFNVLWISRRIGRGQLDHVLIQPRPIWTALLTEGFLPLSLALSLLPGFLLMFWALLEMGIPHTPGWWALLGLNMAASGAIVVAFSFLWGSLAFWAPAGAEEISSSAMKVMTELKSFPLDGVAPGPKISLLSILPVGLVAWQPCRSLLGVGGPDSASPFGVWFTPAAAALFCALACVTFTRGLRRYLRTGSQRYIDHGHRR